MTSSGPADGNPRPPRAVEEATPAHHFGGTGHARSTTSKGHVGPTGRARAPGGHGGCAARGVPDRRRVRCGGRGDHAPDAKSDKGAVAPDEAAGGRYAPGGQRAGDRVEGGATAEGGTAAPDGANGSDRDDRTAKAAAAQIIRTATVTVQTEDVPAAVAKARAAVDGAGGYVGDETTDQDSRGSRQVADRAAGSPRGVRRRAGAALRPRQARLPPGLGQGRHRPGGGRRQPDRDAAGECGARPHAAPEGDDDQ